MLRRSFFFFFVLIGTPWYAFAASLYFSPTEQTVAVGQAFTVAVKVSSVDQAMNAASGDISFPSDKLQVLSVSKSNSIMNLWVRDPSFSNSVDGGDVHFEGIVLNPGFTGSDGTVIQVTFQVVGGVGEVAPLTFSSAAVLANDGNGTGILTSEGSASFAIVQKPAVTPPPTSTAPAVENNVTPTAPPVEPKPVTVNGWFGGAADFFFAWGLIVLLVLLWLAVVIVLADYIVNRSHRSSIGSKREITRERKELRDDLKRIEKELDLDRTNVDSKRGRVRKEIEHLEEDLKRDLEKDK
jgi:hypothetical protein